MTDKEQLSSLVLPLPGAAHPIPSCPLHTLPCQPLSIQFCTNYAPQRPQRKVLDPLELELL